MRGENDFTVGIEFPSQIPVTQAVENALNDMGIGYFNYYLNTFHGNQDLPPEEINTALMELCAGLGIEFSIACHVLDPPEGCVRSAISLGQDGKNKAGFRGVVFDEIEWARLLWDCSKDPLADHKNFRTLEQAYRETLEGFKNVRTRFEHLGSDVVATHVYPVLLHAAARAGFTVCPKTCKEFYSPVSLAIGMGAAKQYGVDMWADCDLWFWDLIPGHTPEEMKSNLLMAYWLGADLVYIEGAGYNLRPAGKQGTPFSLMNQIDSDTYQLTPHGEALRWFCKDYLPKHPRSWTFRDVRPNIAIIRFDDTCTGQRYSSFPDDLYGSPCLRSTPDTEAWLQIWNVLTFGKTGCDGLSFFKNYDVLAGYQSGINNHKDRASSYLTRSVQADMHRFFVPLNGVVVYDDTVGYDLLKGVPLLFLTGLEVSDRTMFAIRRCVNEGAVCAAWGPLAAKHGFSYWKSGTVVVVNDGKGKFVSTDDFGDQRAFNEIRPFLGRPDEIRYDFGKHTVVLRRVTDNEIAVETE